MCDLPSDRLFAREPSSVGLERGVSAVLEVRALVLFRQSEPSKKSVISLIEPH